MDSVSPDGHFARTRVIGRCGRWGLFGHMLRSTLGRRSSRSESNHQLNQDGAAIVEFALIIPTLLMFLMGIVSSGVLLNSKVSITYSAREGARYGALHDLSDANWADTVADFVTDRGDGDFARSDVCVSLVTGANAAEQVFLGSPIYSTKGGLTPCVKGDGATSGTTRVQVTINRTADFDGAFFKLPVNLHSQATGRFEE